MKQDIPASGYYTGGEEEKSQPLWPWMSRWNDSLCSQPFLVFLVYLFTDRRWSSLVPTQQLKWPSLPHNGRGLPSGRCKDTALCHLQTVRAITHIVRSNAVQLLGRRLTSSIVSFFVFLFFQKYQGISDNRDDFPQMIWEESEPCKIKSGSLHNEKHTVSFFTSYKLIQFSLRFLTIFFCCFLELFSLCRKN